MMNVSVDSSYEMTIVGVSKAIAFRAKYGTPGNGKGETVATLRYQALSTHSLHEVIEIFILFKPVTTDEFRDLQHFQRHVGTHNN